MNRSVDIDWRGRAIRIEYGWVGADDHAAPLMVFLHEGLGSLALWKDFPQRLCDRLGFRGLVYSRPGYGRSTPRPPDEGWQPDFMHRQAHEVLPALFDALGIDPRTSRPWLFGHSDGGSIALLYAARAGRTLSGLVVLAPHILVEPISLHSIRLARDAYRDGDLRERLARHHDDPDSAFGGWAGAWLDPAFASWRIDREIATIECPILAIQGVEDSYGTLEQIRGIRRCLPGTRLLELSDCGHSPHRDQPEAVIAATEAFVSARGRP